MYPSYKSVSIANYFIEKAIYDGVEITPMKVLKLVYIAHGWYLAVADNPLITEQTEAWKYGPVVPNVYHTFKAYGKNDISEIHQSDVVIRKDFRLLKEDDKTLLFLDRIWEVYKKFSGGQLSSLTHQKDTPWYITWNKNGGSLKDGAIIANRLIKQYYKEKKVNNKA
ncbi:MAG: SocA family protein [Phaeodactylibacter sp.]|nr:SocA family protein [Phaeodactylibacter sp.]